MNTENIIVVDMSGYNLLSVMLPVSAKYKNMYTIDKKAIDKTPHILSDILTNYHSKTLTICILNENLHESKQMENKLINVIDKSHKVSSKRIEYITSIKINT